MNDVDYLILINEKLMKMIKNKRGKERLIN